jgi:hypothetical protein
VYAFVILEVAIKDKIINVFPPSPEGTFDVTAVSDLQKFRSQEDADLKFQTPALKDKIEIRAPGLISINEK